MAKAIGMIEFNSIARGIYAADQMVKTSDVDIVTANSVCPGKYIAIVHGDVSAVETSVQSGVNAAGEFLVDQMVIPNVHPGVFPAIVSTTMPEQIQAIGILESYSLATMVIASDAVLKAAELEALEIRLGTGLGGRSYFTFTGDVAAVEAGVDAGKNIIGGNGMLINAEVIPSPSKKLVERLY
ncbi:MAG: BMC domain-containing protein [Hornefia sp.]|nr:BMC domain-containing protein [Hornefia sp.]